MKALIAWLQSQIVVIGSSHRWSDIFASSYTFICFDCDFVQNLIHIRYWMAGILLVVLILLHLTLNFIAMPTWNFHEYGSNIWLRNSLHSEFTFTFDYFDLYVTPHFYFYFGWNVENLSIHFCVIAVYGTKEIQTHTELLQYRSHRAMAYISLLFWN